MANFGFSIGDIILVSDIAYNVYKSARNAGNDFKAISIDGRVSPHESATAMLTGEHSQVSAISHPDVG